MKIRKNDTVLVIAGKERGKVGKVHRVFDEEDRILVEGINIVKRHMKASGKTKQTGIIEREASIHVSNVMLLCTKCNHPARLAHRVLADGGKVRICGACQEVID
ncbi:MAG: 50S ribosomal protein L24 [Chloroflexi bacterium]|nr:50S ribosomal protein L24 [Chloroflexota bacterium]